ncbi:hypothetical protein BDQ17DRAFT_1431996 [Cyathus striatus]|nr:hypothetical protein BDQ17DRAFT_1431996 [Cyathus striatus]
MAKARHNTVITDNVEEPLPTPVSNPQKCRSTAVHPPNKQTSLRGTGVNNKGLNEAQQLQQLSQYNPEVISKYLEKVSRRTDPSDADEDVADPEEYNDDDEPLPESEDDKDVLDSNTFSHSIQPVPSARPAPVILSLHTFSSFNSPQPLAVPVSRMGLAASWNSSPAPVSSPGPENFVLPDGQKPAISDYIQDAQPVLQMVVDEYKVCICTVEAFPSEKASLGWMRDIWTQAMDSQGEDWVLTEHIRHLIRSRGSHIRGHVIKTVRPLIQPHYGFSGVANTMAAIKNQRLLDHLLANSAFHYQNPQLLKGYCQNLILANILSSTWFMNQNANGIVFNNYFNPIPNVCLALIFTALSFGIEEWLTGSHKQASFTEKVAEAKYNAHLKDVEAWSSINPVVTEKIHKQMCDCARHSTGINADEQAAPQLVGDLLESARKELEGRMGDSDVDELDEPEPEEEEH